LGLLWIRRKHDDGVLEMTERESVYHDYG